jgi:hypothetical protein
MTITGYLSGRHRHSSPITHRQDRVAAFPVISKNDIGS